MWSVIRAKSPGLVVWCTTMKKIVSTKKHLRENYILHKMKVGGILHMGTYFDRVGNVISWLVKLRSMSLVNLTV